LRTTANATGNPVLDEAATRRSSSAFSTVIITTTPDGIMKT
jgi:hypothetical protein